MEGYEPSDQDIVINQALDAKISVINCIITSLPTKKTVSERRMVIAYDEFQNSIQQYQQWQSKKTTDMRSVPPFPHVNIFHAE